jgi:hypothetical protein
MNHHNVCFPPPRQPASGLSSRRRRLLSEPVCCADVKRTSRPDARAADCCQALQQGRAACRAHRIGREKARFPSLRVIPVFVKDVALHLLAIQWYVTCRVLHNIATIDGDLLFKPNPEFDDIVPHPPPSQVHLVPSEEQL